MGILFLWVFKSSAILTFSIIKTNRNNTATAPTYTIKKVMGKNSKLKSINNADTLKKVKIRNNTENMGLFVKITKNEDVKLRAHITKKI